VLLWQLQLPSTSTKFGEVRSRRRFVVFVSSSSFVVRRSSFVVRRSSFVVRRSSFVVRRSSFVAVYFWLSCLSFVVCGLWFVVVWRCCWCCWCRLYLVGWCGCVFCWRGLPSKPCRNWFGSTNTKNAVLATIRVQYPLSFVRHVVSTSHESKRPNVRATSTTGEQRGDPSLAVRWGHADRR